VSIVDPVNKGRLTVAARLKPCPDTTTYQWQGLKRLKASVPKAKAGRRGHRQAVVWVDRPDGNKEQTWAC